MESKLTQLNIYVVQYDSYEKVIFMNNFGVTFGKGMMMPFLKTDEGHI